MRSTFDVRMVDGEATIFVFIPSHSKAVLKPADECMYVLFSCLNALFYREGDHFEVFTTINISHIYNEEGKVCLCRMMLKHTHVDR